MVLRAPASGVISHSNAKIGDVAAAVPLPPPFGPEPAFRIIVGNELEIEGGRAEHPSGQGREWTIGAHTVGQWPWT